MRRFASVILGSAVLWVVSSSTSAADSDPANFDFFEKKVRPVLVEHCFKCHAGPKVKGGLRLDSREAVLKGGDNGPAMVAGEPERSRLVEAVRYKNVDLQMPPRGKLSDAVIADLAAWVKSGAPWPAEKSTIHNTTPAAFDLQKRKNEHWAWQPIRPQAPPAVADRDWPRSPIDAFILAQLEAKQLRPAPPAARRTLLRRLSFDLTGLPPTSAEMEVALRDKSPDWLAKVVDRLLDSPHYGERWGRHWLDLVRYAESRGHEFDYVAPNAYQYRDYVIRALNADVPYDQFVTEHIAGDRLPAPRRHPVAGFNESILGTGFWFLGEQVHSPVDVRQDEADRFDNMIDVFGKTFLGLTVACARCHDHKFDAISTKDYYALFGFLRSSIYRLAPFDTMDHNGRVAAELAKLRTQHRKPLQAAVAASLAPTLERLADYLLAAREATLAGTGMDRARIEEIARTRKVDAAHLEQWITHLGNALRDADDPLHAWAKVAADAGANDARRLAEVLKPLIEAGRKRTTAAPTALQSAEVVIDYGQAGPDAWLPDGFAFGPGPVRPGEIRFGTEANRPILQVFDRAAAVKDATWDRQTLASGTEKDPGALGNLVRAGRTISTPTFALTTGKVYYLVKGVGQAYAAVDSHSLINGPLHARFVLPLKTGDKWQWIGHDLNAYKGQRLHVEFTAAGSGDFAVAMVVQAERPPGSLDRPNELLQRVLESAMNNSVASLAQAYQQLFLDTNKRLAADQVGAGPQAADCARLADWLVRHPTLLATNDIRLTETAAPLLAEQARVIGQVQRESRLALAIMDGSGEDEHVFIRGSHKALGDKVPRRFLEALAGSAPLAASGSGRLELARQLVDPQRDPFVARVLVNRVWHHLFGRGIVGSVDNFGVLGEAPTHPELLDYMAVQFVREGWSIKKLIRTLVLTGSYQMSAQAGPGDTLDPQDLLLHRQRIRRLEGEAIRDALLHVGGRLDPRMFGPAVPVNLTEFQEGRGRPASGPLDGAGRRSIYLAVRRNFLSPLLLAFDTPIPFSTVGRRTVSNVPAQSLILLNDPLVALMAQQWARQVLARPVPARERVAGMYLDAFSRPPTENEVAACLDFLERQARLNNGKADDPAAWADLAHVLFNAKEFIFLN